VTRQCHIVELGELCGVMKRPRQMNGTEEIATALTPLKK
jgi:hypothetical protein